MANDLLAGLDEIDFAELTGDWHAQNISWLLRSLAETARTPAAAGYVSGLLKTELTKDHLVASDAPPLAALFVARMAIHHPLPFVRTAALRLFDDLDLCDEDEDEGDLVHQVRKWALRDAYAAMRQAEADEDVGSAIHLIAVIEGGSARLHKQMRRLELHTRSIQTHEAIEAVRQQASRVKVWRADPPG